MHTKNLTRNELKSLLNNFVYDISFEKSDGTIRFMKCTTLSEHIPPAPEPKPDAPVKKARAENLETIPVYEIDTGWRSFRIDSLITMEVVNNDVAD